MTESDKPQRQPTGVLRLTLSELELLYTEMNSCIEGGAEDKDYPSIRKKTASAIAKVRAAAAIGKEMT